QLVMQRLEARAICKEPLLEVKQAVLKKVLRSHPERARYGLDELGSRRVVAIHDATDRRLRHSDALGELLLRALVAAKQLPDRRCESMVAERRSAYSIALDLRERLDEKLVCPFRMRDEGLGYDKNAVFGESVRLGTHRLRKCRDEFDRGPKRPILE